MKAVTTEMGRLATQVGVSLNDFFPETQSNLIKARAAFARIHRAWLNTFYL